MENHIFNPNSLFSDQNKKVTQNLGLYTLVGQEDYLDSEGNAQINADGDENKVFAKKTTLKDGSIKYTIRLSNNNKLYNPISIYGVEQESIFLNRVCRSNKKFKEVNEKAFSWYLKFLNSKNTSWLYNAERETE